MKIKVNIGAILLIAATGAVLLTGCVNQIPDGENSLQPVGGTIQQNGMQQTGGPGGQFRNRSDYSRSMTPELQAQIRRQAVDACAGKAVNETCTITTARGENAGNCLERNGTLSCAAAGRRFNPTREAQGLPPQAPK